MTLAAYVPPALNGVPIAPRDRVRVPDGRVGEVLGFYRGEIETVVVRLGGGNSGLFVPADLRPPAEMEAASVKASSFHAVGALDVHHDNDDCKTGNLIEQWNRAAGDAGLPLCNECATLSAARGSHRAGADLRCDNPEVASWEVGRGSAFSSGENFCPNFCPREPT